MDKISIVVPCFNEEQMIDMFYSELVKVMSGMKDIEYEILFVDDGSKDTTCQKLCTIAAGDKCVRYISFSKNFGKEAAMLAGINHASGDYTVVMDADLQHPPALIPKMYGIITSGNCDCVATCRSTRKNEPVVRSFFAKAFYRIFNKLCGLDMVDGAMDFRMMTRQMIEAIKSLPEHGRFSKGIFSWVGFTTEWIEYENIERVAGQTKWSFTKLLLYAIEGFTSFSHFPLYVPALGGIFLTGASILAAIVTLILHLADAVCISNLWIMILVMLFMFGLQFMLLGVFGGYIAKIFVESKNRPHYIIRATNIGGENHEND